MTIAKINQVVINPYANHITLASCVKVVFSLRENLHLDTASHRVNDFTMG